MVYLLEITICAIVLTLIGFSYLFIKYVDVRFEEEEDH